METKRKTKSRCKNKTNGTLNRLENGALDFHVTNNSHSSLSGPQCKFYKSNGDIDMGLLNDSGASVNLSEEKENGIESEKDINMITDEVRNRAFRWCHDSLGGSWSRLGKEDLVITPICGGTSNYLYLISLPPSHPPTNSEPTEVVLRIYGEIMKTTKDFLVHNSVVFALLAEKKLGPKPFAMYHDGRIEEFIKAEPLGHRDLRRPEIMSIVSKKMARFHSLNMPLCQKPSWFKGLVKGWIDEVQKNKTALSVALAEVQKLSPSVDLVKEYEMLIKLASDLQSPVVFCHHDFQSGNLLYQPATANTPSDIVVIDTEYACYDYRGQDVANHFIEWTFDLTCGGMPGFKWFPERFPTKEEQYSFFKSYLEACGVTEVTEEALASLYKESNYLVMHSHFLWGFWSLIQILKSSIEFDYMAYAVCRFDGYFRQKEKLVALFGEELGDKQTSQ